jgi:ubiquinone/menaquinone biosynthesis C-methylase UbiE
MVVSLLVRGTYSSQGHPPARRIPGVVGSAAVATQEHFDRLAARYSALRASPAFVDPVTEAVAELAQLAGCRVLDVGCGPATVLRQLVRAYGVEAAGVDRSERMIEAARREAPEVGDLRAGLAEELPFAGASFDAVLMRMVVQHLDRPRAFAEARRVLRPAGRLAITSTDPALFPTYWTAPYFPSYERIERARFPAGEMLRDELAGAGFAGIRVVPFALRRRFSREEALAKLRGRAFSTFALMTDEEYEAGLAAAEAGLPAEIAYDLRLLNVVAQAG